MVGAEGRGGSTPFSVDGAAECSPNVDSLTRRDSHREDRTILCFLLLKITVEDNP